MHRHRLPSFALPLLALCLLSSGAAEAQIQVSFEYPKSGEVLFQDFWLTVSIQSVYQLESVRAEYAGKTVPMPVAASSTITIALDDLPYGEQEFVVTARDVRGNEGRGTVTAPVDRLPKLILEEPSVGGVARPGLHLRARCEDDNPSGCTVRVSAIRTSVGSAGPWEARNVFDQELCLEQFSGKTLFFTLYAADEHHTNPASAGRQVVVEPSARLTEVARAPGVLLDFDSERLLFLDGQRRARVMDRASGRIVTLLENVLENAYPCPTTCPREPNRGLLVPGGALIISGFKLFYATETGQVQLDSESHTHVPAAGPYVLVRPLGGPELRNLATGTTTPVPGATANASVAEDGTVVYLSSGNFFRFRDGQTEQLSHAGTASSPWVTDGSRVVFSRSAGDSWQTVFLQEGQESVLDERAGTEPGAFMLAHGWTAFTRLGGGVPQVWLRSPQGQLTQISSWGTHSLPTALGPDGQLIYLSGSQHYLGTPGTDSIPFAGQSYRLFKFAEGIPYMELGNTLFRVNPSGPAEPLTCPVAPPAPEPERPRKEGCAAAGLGSAWGVAWLLVALSILRRRRRSGASPL